MMNRNELRVRWYICEQEKRTSVRKKKKKKKKIDKLYTKKRNKRKKKYKNCFAMIFVSKRRAQKRREEKRFTLRCGQGKADVFVGPFFSFGLFCLFYSLFLLINFSLVLN